MNDDGGVNFACLLRLWLNSQVCNNDLEVVVSGWQLLLPLNQLQTWESSESSNKQAKPNPMLATV